MKKRNVVPIFILALILMLGIVLMGCRSTDDEEELSIGLGATSASFQIRDFDDFAGIGVGSIDAASVSAASAIQPLTMHQAIIPFDEEDEVADRFLVGETQEGEILPLEFDSLGADSLPDGLVMNFMRFEMMTIYQIWIGDIPPSISGMGEAVEATMVNSNLPLRLSGWYNTNIQSHIYVINNQNGQVFRLNRWFRRISVSSVDHSEAESGVFVKLEFSPLLLHFGDPDYLAAEGIVEFGDDQVGEQRIFRLYFDEDGNLTQEEVASVYNAQVFGGIEHRFYNIHIDTPPQVDRYGNFLVRRILTPSHWDGYDMHYYWELARIYYTLYTANGELIDVTMGTGEYHNMGSIETGELFRELAIPLIRRAYNGRFYRIENIDDLYSQTFLNSNGQFVLDSNGPVNLIPLSRQNYLGTFNGLRHYFHATTGYEFWGVWLSGTIRHTWGIYSVQLRSNDNTFFEVNLVHDKSWIYLEAGQMQRFVGTGFSPSPAELTIVFDEYILAVEIDAILSPIETPYWSNPNRLLHNITRIAFMNIHDNTALVRTIDLMDYLNGYEYFETLMDRVLGICGNIIFWYTPTADWALGYQEMRFARIVLDEELNIVRIDWNISEIYYFSAVAIRPR
ncbi:MAG: hypothetical protein FWE03_01500 [Firmicutes bacterium]|nr:hypothetical protein [Bacillota bacterium]